MLDAKAKHQELEALNEMDGPVFKIKDVAKRGTFVQNVHCLIKK